ncbi:uncharacterized protein LOC135216931 isoform X1 [Macrobrachium nipponense]|uniref:uncharacterized protein LOC135216931 isoform X1 n=1 Tax=Macrobrachium nipponense TaxID=159736 RepID=UPI0030C7E2D7
MRWRNLVGFLGILCVTVVSGCVYPRYTDEYDDEDAGSGVSRRRFIREVTLHERSNCTSGEIQPRIRVDTSERVAALRQQMLLKGFDAYIVPSDDEHQSEYVSAHDERRKYITGFSGSAGTAVVTRERQALWTDGRYFLQADDQLDCNWLLMKQKNEGVPKMTEWITQNLVTGSKVGADPRLIGAETWKVYAEELAEADIELVALETNLIDLIWPAEERAPHSTSPLMVHELKFAGRRWEDKVADVRTEMEKHNADLLVLSALDEIAWLLNLRGDDIPFNPVFRSYVLIGKRSMDVYLPHGKITPAVDHHLKVNQCNGQECVRISDYLSVLDHLRALKLKNEVKKVMLPSKFSYSGGVSFAVYSAVPEDKRIMATSPVLLMKARKNRVESQGMKNAHIKDAVALCDFLSLLEMEVKDGKYWDEFSAAQKVEEFRSQQKDFVSTSFATISAFGSNGAVIHYHPQRETNKQIDNTSLYLLDSGGQYKDGTTDVTRTMHYGEPTPYQVETYTRVLQGAIDLASLVFPEGTGDTNIDIMARRHLYEVGLDYRHGTGHGIGMFLNVHEAPIQVRIYGTEEHKFEVGHFFSDEPGFYQDNEFGIRLETILTVVNKETPYEFDKNSLGFEPVTLVPFEENLINFTMLTSKQCQWLNNYHAHVRDIVGRELIAQGRKRGYDWLISKTERLPCVSDKFNFAPDFEDENSVSSRKKREITAGYRSNCSMEVCISEICTDTTVRVERLRREMTIRGLDAYIIPSGDAHQSEYVPEADKRVRYISSFTGSAATVVVTMDKQALWTDGRYFLQAERELDCNWLIMKERADGVPKLTEWLKQELSNGSQVGADPRLLSADLWKSYEKEISETGIEFIQEETNLVDLVWPDDERPSYSEDPLFIHELQFAGKRWEEKVAEVRAEMESKGADLLVLSQLDEIAWLLNLRGSHTPYNPMFRAYVFIGRNSVELLIPNGKITPAVDNHLNVNRCGEEECVLISGYSTILNRLQALEVDHGITKVMLPSKYSYSGGVSYAIYSAVPEEKRLVAVSPVLLMKARKNPVEINGMINAHVKDAVAVCEFLSILENEIQEGKEWDELKAQDALEDLRMQQEDFMGLSFQTISAFGPNGAVIHYKSRPETNRAITTDSLYLLDSGGQYKDGTTDVTRTMHYGDPTEFQKESYTRVLMGAIDLAILTFPEGTSDKDVDIIARKHLYEVGLDYRHGTGHGIGVFLSIHEAPTQIRIYATEEHKFEVGQFFSDEPGFYQDNDFGIRLETILRVVPKETRYKFDKQSLGFEAVTLVPFEAKLIDMNLISDVQCEWLNSYHNNVRHVIGMELEKQGKNEAYDWLIRKTEPLVCHQESENPANDIKVVEEVYQTETVRSTYEASSSTSASTKGADATKIEYTTSAITTNSDIIGDQVEPAGGISITASFWVVLIAFISMIIW